MHMELDQKHLVLTELSSEFSQNKFLSKAPLTIVGDGNQSRDFVYVTDLSNAFYKAATQLTKKYGM